MEKDRLVHVTDPDTLAAIERKDFHSPEPATAMKDGRWVYAWSLEQFYIHCLELDLNP